MSINAAGTEFQNNYKQDREYSYAQPKYENTDYDLRSQNSNQSSTITKTQMYNSSSALPLAYDFPQSKTFEVNENNVYKVLTLFNKFKYVNPLILTQYNTNLHLSDLPKQVLLKKNQVYLKTDTAPVAFGNLMDMFYLKATPIAFQEKYSSYTGKYNLIYDMYFAGVIGFALFSRRASKKYMWFKLTKCNSFFMNSLISIWGSMIVINELQVQGMKRLCRNNIQIMDSVFQTHIKLIKAHGVDINKAIQFYSRQLQPNQGQTNSNSSQKNLNMQNSISSPNNNISVSYNFSVINSANLKEHQSLEIPRQMLQTELIQENKQNFNNRNSYVV